MVQTEELSEEDQQLKGELEMLVERLQEPKTDLYKPALQNIKDIIKTSTSSMTAVPKPLKFLRPHYASLEIMYTEWGGKTPEVPDDRVCSYTPVACQHSTEASISRSQRRGDQDEGALAGERVASDHSTTRWHLPDIVVGSLLANMQHSEPLQTYSPYWA